MAKGGRSRYTKRPMPAVKRTPATPPHKLPDGPAVVATTPPRPTSATVVPVTPSPSPTPSAPDPTPVATLTIAATKRKTTAPPLSTAAQWVSAFTRGFPFVLTEYCLFLLAVFAGATVAISVGAVLIILIAVNRMTRGKVIALLPATVVHEAEALLGQRDDVLISLGIIGVGLLCWAMWHIAGIMLFSWLSIVALLAALFLLFYAQRLQTPRET